MFRGLSGIGMQLIQDELHSGLQIYTEKPLIIGAKDKSLQMSAPGVHLGVAGSTD